MLQSRKPRLNKIVLRAIGRLRREFPDNESRSRRVAEFLDRHAILAPQRAASVAQIKKLLQAKGGGDAAKQAPGPAAHDQSAPIPDAPKNDALPKSLLVFDATELKLIRQTLSVRLAKHLEPEDA